MLTSKPSYSGPIYRNLPKTIKSPKNNSRASKEKHKLFILIH